MSERLSALPSVNRSPSSEHPDDLAEREAVRRVLGTVRTQQGLSIMQLAKVIGHDDTMVYHWEDMDWSSYRMSFADLFGWAGALNMAYSVELDGLGSTIGPWHDNQCAMVMETLSAVRARDGWQITEVARRLDVSESTVRDLEKSPNPRISTAQRYTRALGGRLLLRPRILKPLH